jgi:hypothetical protein
MPARILFPNESTQDRNKICRENLKIIIAMAGLHAPLSYGTTMDSILGARQRQADLEEITYQLTE